MLALILSCLKDVKPIVIEDYLHGVRKLGANLYLH